MKRIPKKPTPDERCAHHYPDGRQCAAWRVKPHSTCSSHTPEYQQRMRKKRPFIAKNQNNYKHGLRAAPLKPQRQNEDVLDNLIVKHFELFLAAETAAQEDNLPDLSRLSTHLTNVTLKYFKTLKKTSS
jgi:hypothetical protein